MTEPTPEEIRASRTKLLTLIAIAFVPIMIAFLAFQYFPGWVPSGTTNQGELISPPINGAEISARLEKLESWGLLQPAGRACDSDCEQMLYLSRQVVTGLGKDAGRISRMLIVPGDLSDEFRDLLGREHPDVEVIAAETGLLDAVSEESPLLFLVDPNGNVMMYYSTEKAGKPMLRDLKHLLRLSNIG